jgi:hypothetical protein
MLDKLIKASSIAGAFLIFSGVLKLIFFYSAFNIKIVDFLTFSEILTSFLDDINVLLLLVGLMIFQSLTVFGLLHWKTNLAWDRLIEQLMAFAYIHKQKYLIFFGAVVLVLSVLLATEILEYYYAIIYVMLFFTLQFLTIVFLTKDEETNKIDTPDHFAVLSGLITVIVGIFLLAQHDIEGVKFDNQVSCRGDKRRNNKMW